MYELPEARAPGKIVIYRHALKNAMIRWPSLWAQIGMDNRRFGCPGIVFSIPGIGRLMVDAILARDFPVVQGNAGASSIIFANILADVLYAVVDQE